MQYLTLKQNYRLKFFDVKNQTIKSIKKCLI